MNHLNARITSILLITLLTIISLPTNAGELDIVVNGMSYHINSNYDWNEKNIGAGLEYEMDSKTRWVKTLNGNAFLDSMENMSYMAGGGLKRRLYTTQRFGGLYLDAGVVAFIMARADINNYRPFPGILPALTVGNDYVGLNLTYLPKKAVHDMAHANELDPTIGGVLFMQFKFRAKAFRNPQ